MTTSADLLTSLEADLLRTLVRDRIWAAPRLQRIRQRLGAGEPVDRLLAECRVRILAGVEAVQRRSETALHIDYPEQLPVSAARGEIQAALAARNCLVLVGETGSGKTTQLPKMLLEMGYGRQGFIAMTQPRRIAAVSMAERLREELRASGDAVVHSVRFDDQSSDATLVRVMTDGLLLAEFARDRDLSRYAAIIVDEAHERSTNIDLLLALLRVLRRRRPDLVVAVSSASIAAEAFAAHLGDSGDAAPIVRVGGRTHPVEIRWRPPADDDLGYLAAALTSIRDIHRDEGSGDILVFLPTERDILEAMRRLRDLKGVTILPCFGRLSASEQKRIFLDAPGRKVVLATNIAETSLTIPGIVFVVDAGMARIKRFHIGARTERLPVEAVAQASCIQRAGRAGRIQPGVCVRLYGEDDFAKRLPYAEPEILRSNLAGVLLHALHLGLKQPEQLPWLDAPTPQAWRVAWTMLEELGAVRIDQGDLTALGRQMASLPVDPAVSRILLAGIAEGVPHEACTLAAFLSVQDPRVRPLGEEAKADAAHRAFRHEAGDLTSILMLWDRLQAEPSQGARARFAAANYLGVRRIREWSDVRHQLWSIMRDQTRSSLPAEGHLAGAWPIDAVHRSVLAGMIGNILRRDAEQRCYRSAGNREAHIHPASTLRSGKADDGKRAPPAPDWILSCELVETTRLFARACAPIDPEWVITLAGDRVRREYRDVRYDERRQQVVCTERISWKGLVLRDGRSIAYERIDAVAATHCFAQALAGDAGIAIAKTLPALAADQDLLQRLRGLRHRLRRSDLDVDAQALAAWYAERLTQAPYPVASTAALRRFLKEFTNAALALDAERFLGAPWLAVADAQAPEQIDLGIIVPIRYHYALGDADDGASVTLREEDLGRINIHALERGIPAWWEAAIEQWIRALPKDQRRHLQPQAQCAAEIAAEVRAGDPQLSLADMVHAAFERRLGPTRRPDPAVLEPYLHVYLRIIADDGTTLYAGRDLGMVRGQAAGHDPLHRLRARHQSEPAEHWPECSGNIPHSVRDAAQEGWLGLARDRSASGTIAARLTVYPSAASAGVWHADGVEALIEAGLAEDLAALVAAPMAGDLAALIERQLGLRVPLLRRSLAVEAAIEGLPTVATAEQHAQALNDARRRLPKIAELDRWLGQCARIAEHLRQRLKRGARQLGEAAAARQVAADLERLLRPGWPHRLPWSAARRLDGFLQALMQRLDRSGADAAVAQRMAQRVADVLDDASQVMDEDSRLLQVLGQRHRARQVAADVEDCLLALAVPGANAALGFAEKRLRDTVRDLYAVLTQAKRGIDATRALLGEARSIAQGIRDQRRRQALLAEIDGILAHHPDCSLGADLSAQASAAQALIQRVRLLATA